MKQIQTATCLRLECACIAVENLRWLGRFAQNVNLDYA